MADHKNGDQVAGIRENSYKSNARTKSKDGSSAAKRKCVSTACIACRRRKSKCDGNMPSCAACASVYGTECVYDPNSDHRRKGVYKKGFDSAKTQDATLRVLIEGILNCPENEVLDLVKQIRTCESLEDVANGILERASQLEEEDEDLASLLSNPVAHNAPRFEQELSGKILGLRLENGAVQFVGGTSNLLYIDNESNGDLSDVEEGLYSSQEEAIRSWTTVTQDTSLILHLLHMYFTWHYSYFTTLSRSLFFRDFLKGRLASPTTKTVHCTPLLVNAMLTLGCHFTSWPTARADPEDSATAGDHFFRECKSIIMNNDEHEYARVVTVQALCLMSVREAGCGREAKGWIYSGMSFRMAMDLGLPYESSNAQLPDEEADARRVTFWGCYLFDKCWSNYLGRPPQLSLDSITMKKPDVFPQEDADIWTPWTDAGMSQSNAQPARTRAIALQISALCEISSDLILSFYRPNQLEKPLGKQAELKKLSDLHTRLEAWKRDLPKELDAKEGQLPQVLIMHMFFYLLFIHLFRPFLKYSQNNSPLPSHVSPRRHCTQAAAAISKLLRLYKKTHGLRQICNIAVYITHSACTIHLLNLQDKDARRDLAHGLRHLEEIADCWLCARKTLHTIHQQIRKWEIDLPDESRETLDRADAKFQFSKMKQDGRSDGGSPAADLFSHPSPPAHQHQQFPDPMLSPSHSSHTDALSVASGPTMQGQPQTQPQAQAQNSGRVRSPSSTRRAELLRQMQQNSLQNMLTQPPPPPFPTKVSQAPVWNENIWKPKNEMHSSNGAGRKSTQPQPQSQQRPSSVATNSQSAQTIMSPTAMFAPQQVNLFEEQRDWWLRDQSALFDHWTKRDSVSGVPAGGVAMPAQPTGANGLMAADMFTGLADAQLGAPNRFSMNGNGNALPPGWDNFDMMGNRNGNGSGDGVWGLQ